MRLIFDVRVPPLLVCFCSFPFLLETHRSMAFSFSICGKGMVALAKGLTGDSSGGNRSFVVTSTTSGSGSRAGGTKKGGMMGVGDLPPIARGG